jgi:hypothetical protein
MVLVVCDKLSIRPVYHVYGNVYININVRWIVSYVQMTCPSHLV